MRHCMERDNKILDRIVLSVTCCASRLVRLSGASLEDGRDVRTPAQLRISMQQMDKIERLRKQAQQAKARLDAALARERAQKRKDETRAKIMLGAVLTDQERMSYFGRLSEQDQSWMRGKFPEWCPAEPPPQPTQYANLGGYGQ